MVVEEFEQVRATLRADADRIAAELAATEQEARAAIDAAAGQALSVLTSLDERVRAEIAAERAAVEERTSSGWADDEPWTGPAAAEDQPAGSAGPEPAGAEPADLGPSDDELAARRTRDGAPAAVVVAAEVADVSDEDEETPAPDDPDVTSDVAEVDEPSGDQPQG